MFFIDFLPMDGKPESWLLPFSGLMPASNFHAAFLSRRDGYDSCNAEILPPNAQVLNTEVSDRWEGVFSMNG